MKLTLKIWRQKNAQTKGKLMTYQVNDISPDMSFLEMLDVLNQQIILKGEDPVAFDNDCREGICGMCSLYINGRAHGAQSEATVCQLHMRSFNDDDTIVIEPWRAKAFPVIKDLVVDRSTFDKIIQAGGFVSAKTGAPHDANAILIPKKNADLAMDAASCIGCGACVASCKNASAMLFVSAKISQLALLPQGEGERDKRALAMVRVMDESGFGNCTNEGECEAECPKAIKITNIARLFREYYRANLLSEEF